LAFLKGELSRCAPASLANRRHAEISDGKPCHFSQGRLDYQSIEAVPGMIENPRAGDLSFAEQLIGQIVKRHRAIAPGCRRESVTLGFSFHVN
jgi:hypothetical protein